MVKLQASSKKELASFLEQSEVIYVVAFKRSLKGTFAQQMNPIESGYFITYSLKGTFAQQMNPHRIGIFYYV